MKRSGDKGGRVHPPTASTGPSVLKQVLLRRLATNYHASLSSTYRCFPSATPRNTHIDNDLSRLIVLLERREQIRFQRASADLDGTIHRKAKAILEKLPKTRRFRSKKPENLSSTFDISPKTRKKFVKYP